MVGDAMSPLEDHESLVWFSAKLFDLVVCGTDRLEAAKQRRGCLMRSHKR